MFEKTKQIFVLLSASWLLASLIMAGILITKRPWDRDLGAASPAVAGASAAVDEEHERLIYRYFPDKLSQHWEEMLVRDYFQDMRGGVFVDVGANHHRTRSTTHYLDVALGWTGIAIDAIGEFAAGYEEHRPGTTFVTAFVGEESDEDIEFYIIPHNTRLSTADREQADRSVRDEEAETRVVKTASLSDILDAHGIERIDLLKMDIELWEPPALRGFDIDRFKPGLVVVEYHQEVRGEIAAYMDAHGYVEVERYMRWDPNAWFVPEEDLDAFLGR